ncbi:MAG: cytochrome P450 [Actinomycetota bacterium]|nr:cytochrome P450 [Actinomycetota bacterium]
MTFDPYDPDFLDDPYPAYARLREETPVFYDVGWELTFVGRHEMVSSILKNREGFGRDFRHRLSLDEVDPDLYRRIYPPQLPMWTRYIRESFIDLEPPRHTRLRRLVSKAFTRRSSEMFRPRLEEAADRILDQVLEAGSMEAISQFAAPIPLAMIAELMGIPSEDHSKLLDWSHAIVKVFDQNVTVAEGVVADRATTDFVEYLSSVLEQRRGHRGEDLISAMLDVEESGDTLTDEEIVGTSILTLNAGHEATVHAIGNGLLALASNPDQYQSLHQEEVSIASAVDELLRFDSPLQMFERWVLEETELEGHHLGAGSKVGLLFGSANHDPKVFGPDADFLDLSRTPNPHVSYGAGLHFCVGAPLATVELEAAFARLGKRVRSIELVEKSDRIRSLVFRGVETLILGLEAA